MVFKRLEPNNIIVTPFVAHKYWELHSADTGSGISVYRGQFYGGNLRQLNLNSSPQTTDDKNIYLMHQSINSMFFNNFSRDPYGTLGRNNHLQERLMYENVTIISIAQRVFGEGLQGNSVNMIVDLPGNTHALYNPYFQISESISSISDPYLITDTASWYCNPTTTATIDNQTLELQNTTGYGSELYQLISSNSIDSGDYMLTVNVAGISDTSVEQLSIIIDQPTYQYTTFDIPIDEFNSSLQHQIQLNGNSNCYFILKYLNPISNQIIFNEISIRKIEPRRILDDGKGNLYDSEYYNQAAEIKSYIDPIRDAEFNFREGYKIKNKNIDSGSVKISNKDELAQDYSKNRVIDDSKNQWDGYASNIMYKDGIYSTKASFEYVGPKIVDSFIVQLMDDFGTIYEQPVNIQMDLQNSYIRVPHDDGRNLYNYRRDEDFAISGFVQLYEDNALYPPVPPPPPPVPSPPAALEFMGDSIFRYTMTGTPGSIIIARHNDNIYQTYIMTGAPVLMEWINTGSFDTIVYGDIDKISDITQLIDNTTYIDIGSADHLISFNVPNMSQLQTVYFPSASMMTTINGPLDANWIDPLINKYTMQNAGPLTIDFNQNSYGTTYTDYLLYLLYRIYSGVSYSGSFLDITNSTISPSGSAWISVLTSSGGWTIYT